MKKFVLAAVAAATATLVGGAFASTNLDTGVVTGTTGVYVGETNITAATTLPRNGGGAADQTATATFGASFATDAVAYVRYDLPAGVTFVGAPTFAVNGSVGAAIVSVAQGGAGSSFVIFAVAPQAGENLVGANVGTFVTGTGVSVTGKADVSLRYRLYETLTNAANQTLDLKNVAVTNFLSFANAIAITPAATVTQTANVSEPTGAYLRFLGSTLEEDVLGVTVAHTSRALVSTGAASIVTDILANTNSVTVNGDFTFVNQTVLGNVTLTDDATCAGGNQVDLPANTITNTQATFTGVSALNIIGGIVPNALSVCVTANGTTRIPIASFSGTVGLGAQAGFTVAGGATGNGNINRNGTVLKAAFAETTGATGVSSAVHLTNTSAAASAYTVSCVLNNGTVAGPAGSVPPNTAVRYGLRSTLGCPSDGTLRGVQLTFEAPAGSIIGSVVRQNTSTGVASFDGMIGNQ